MPSWSFPLQVGAFSSFLHTSTIYGLSFSCICCSSYEMGSVVRTKNALTNWFHHSLCYNQRFASPITRHMYKKRPFQLYSPLKCYFMSCCLIPCIAFHSPYPYLSISHSSFSTEAAKIRKSRWYVKVEKRKSTVTARPLLGKEWGPPRWGPPDCSPSPQRRCSKL